MRAVLIVVAILALVGFLAVAVVLPQMADAESKDAASALISGADPAKRQVASAATQSKTLKGAGKNVKLGAKSDPKHGEMKWVVSDDGEVRGWNERNAIEISLIPTLQGGAVNWRCRGYPNTAMPASCGGR